MSQATAAGRTYSRAVVAPKEAISTYRLLNWTYQQQMVHAVDNVDLVGPEIDLLLPGRGRSSDGCAKLERIGNIGCEIDGGGYRRRIVHEDAETVAMVIKNMDSIGAHLLPQYAKQGGCPHWDVRQSLIRVVEGGRVKTVEMDKVTVKYRSGNIRQISVLYCPLQTYPDDSYIDLCRAEYTAWYYALVELTLELRKASLKRWKVTEIGAVSEPWRE